MIMIICLRCMISDRTLQTVNIFRGGKKHLVSSLKQPLTLKLDDDEEYFKQSEVHSLSSISKLFLAHNGNSPYVHEPIQ